MIPSVDNDTGIISGYRHYAGGKLKFETTLNADWDSSSKRQLCFTLISQLTATRANPDYQLMRNHFNASIWLSRLLKALPKTAKHINTTFHSHVKKYLS